MSDRSGAGFVGKPGRVYVRVSQANSYHLASVGYRTNLLAASRFCVPAFDFDWFVTGFPFEGRWRLPGARSLPPPMVMTAEPKRLPLLVAAHDSLTAVAIFVL